jgi:competence protein ComEC
MPYGLHHFGRLQLYGVVANAIAVPATSLLVMPAGMAALLLMPLGLEGVALVPMGWGVEIILWAAHTVAGWPGAAQTAVPIPAWGLGLFSAGLLVLCLIPWRVRFAGVALMAAGLASGAAVRAPDLLVSADARLIAIHAGGEVWVERGQGASNLTRDSWLRQWGEEGAKPLPREGRVAGGAITCGPLGCRWSTGAGDVWLARPPARGVRPDVPREECEGLVLIVSAEPLRRRCGATPHVDRFSVWRDGAHAARIMPEGLHLVSDRAARGERPWVPPVPRPRNSREPAAETM